VFAFVEFPCRHGCFNVRRRIGVQHLLHAAQEQTVDLQHVTNNLFRTPLVGTRSRTQRRLVAAVYRGSVFSGHVLEGCDDLGRCAPSEMFRRGGVEWSEPFELDSERATHRASVGTIPLGHEAASEAPPEVLGEIGLEHLAVQLEPSEGALDDIEWHRGVAVRRLVSNFLEQLRRGMLRGRPAGRFQRPHTLMVCDSAKDLGGIELPASDGEFRRGKRPDVRPRTPLGTTVRQTRVRSARHVGPQLTTDDELRRHRCTVER
jgi:hypothetical protein